MEYERLAGEPRDEDGMRSERGSWRGDYCMVGAAEKEKQAKRKRRAKDDKSESHLSILMYQLLAGWLAGVVGREFRSDQQHSTGALLKMEGKDGCWRINRFLIILWRISYNIVEETAKPHNHSTSAKRGIFGVTINIIIIITSRPTPPPPPLPPPPLWLECVIVECC